MRWIEHNAAVEDGGLSLSFFNRTYKRFGWCAANAISKATGRKWIDVLLELSLVEPRVIHEGMTEDKYGTYLKRRGWHRIKPKNKIKIRELPKRGVFVVATATHLNCVIDGVLYDTRDRRQRGVHSYWKKG